LFWDTKGPGQLRPSFILPITPHLPRAASDAVGSFRFSSHRFPTKNIPTIPDAGPKGEKSVADDLEAVLRKIEDWHHGSIAGYRISFSHAQGVWHQIEWNGEEAEFVYKATICA
jgi:hypothetical protein